MDGYEKQANLMKALSHPVRLHILDLLAQGEACVCHLTAALRQRQPYISQQLMILREAGLVLDRKEGTVVYYRLADGHLTEIIASTRELLSGIGIHAHFPALPAEVIEDCPCPRCGSAASAVRPACSDRVPQTPV